MSTAKSLIRQFSMCAYVLQKNVAGISDEEALKVFDDGGSCLNWVVGHILAARNTLFRYLGEEAVWTQDETAPYGRGSGPGVEASKACALSELVSLYTETQDRLLETIGRKADEDLAVPLPEPHEVFGKTIGSMLSALAFHEAYHVGQTGSLRRAHGKSGAIV